MSTLWGILYDNCRNKIKDTVCPFCGESQWIISPEQKYYPDFETFNKHAKDTYGGARLEPVIVVKCSSCGYIAHFDSNILSK